MDKVVQQKFIPSNGFILVKITSEDSDILVAKTDKPTRGEVVAVGGDKIIDKDTTIKAPAKVGDVVVFGSYGVTELTLNAEQHKIVEFEKIRGVLK